MDIADQFGHAPGCLKGWDSVAVPYVIIMAPQRFLQDVLTPIKVEPQYKAAKTCGLGQSWWVDARFHSTGKPACSSPCGLGDNVTPGWLGRRQGKGSHHELVIALEGPGQVLLLQTLLLRITCDIRTSNQPSSKRPSK